MASRVATTVRVLGLVHATGMRANLRRPYLAHLHQTILHVHPDCICVELSPEQLGGTMTSKSKPEYQRAILPAATSCNSRIEPIQPPIARGLKMEADKTRALALAGKSARGRNYLEFTASFGESIVREIHRLVAEPDGIIRLQNHDLHRLAVGTMWRLHGRYLPPEFTRLWKKWNGYMVKRIVESCATVDSGSVLVTVGLEHVPPLRSLLARQREISLVDTWSQWPE